MRARYAATPPLADLAPESLDAYLRHGVVDLPDGTVTLACPPEVEAEIFSFMRGDRGSPPFWPHLAAMASRTRVIAGRRSNLPTEIFDAQAAQVGSEVVWVDGGHLFLQEDPARAAALITTHLAAGFDAAGR
jgi:hypothetical protein